MFRQSHITQFNLPFCGRGWCNRLVVVDACVCARVRTPRASQPDVTLILFDSFMAPG